MIDFTNVKELSSMDCNWDISTRTLEDVNSLYNWSLDNNLHFGMPKCVLLGSNQKHQIHTTLEVLRLPVYLPIET